MEGIRNLKRLIEGPFVDADPAIFGEMCALLVKLCESESRNGIKQHVGLIKIYTELLLTVKHVSALRNAGRVEAMCSHLVKHITEALDLPEEQSKIPPKAIGFYVKRLLQIIHIGNPLIEDDSMTELAARLRYLQVSNHSLNQELTDIEDIWTIARYSIGRHNHPLGPGHLIILCDILEKDIERPPDNVTALLRLLLDSTEEIVKYIFLMVNNRPLFDHSVNGFCVGVSRLETFDLEEEILSAAIEDHISCKQLFCRDILRVLMLIWPDAFGVYQELFQQSEVLNINALTKSDRQNETIKAFLDQCLSGSTARREDASELAQLIHSICPCNAASALLFAFTSAKLATHLDTLSVVELTNILNHHLSVLEDNVHNDCLVIAVCIFISYLGKVSFKDVVDIRLRSAVQRICEKVIKSGRKIGSVFGLAALFSFVKSVDDPRLITQTTKYAAGDLMKTLQGNVRECKLADVVDGLNKARLDCAEPLQNEYFKATKKSETPTGANVKKAPPEGKTRNPIRELCELVFELEKRSFFSQEDRALMKVCLEKLKLLTNK